jgi:hypothetical protein
MQEDYTHARSLLQNVQWGMRWGLIYIAMFGGFAIVLRVVDGPASFAEHHTSLSAFLVAYVASGVAAGLLLGLTRPWLKSGAGSAIVGAAVGSLVGIALLVTNGELAELSAFDVILPGAFAIAGCMTGIALHRKAKQLGRL